MFLGVVTEYNLQKNIRDIALCINFGILESNVPVNFSGTEGFLARSDRRYATRVMSSATYATHVMVSDKYG